MKTAIRIILSFMMIPLLLTSCEKEEDKIPAEMLVGKWVISYSELLTQRFPGDGSYLQFNECLDPCSGIDYDASEGTTGSFTYILNEDGSILEITDLSNDGGNYNFSWDILKLSETHLVIIADTGLFGTLKIELLKQ